MSGLVVTFPDGQRRVQTATLAKQLRVNKKKIYRWVKEGRIPEPVRLNGRIQWHAVAKVKAALADSGLAGANGSRRKHHG